MIEVWNVVLGILGGAISALAVVTVNEMLRRNRRIELYMERLFDKRLVVYEELSNRMLLASEIAIDVMENPEYSAEQRYDLTCAAGHDIAKFVDDNDLYLDKDLGSHCVATFLGIDDIYDAQDINKKEQMKQEFRNMYQNARRKIREDSGIAEINKRFKKIAKPRISSPIIDRIRELRKQRPLP